jgi:ABC-type transport system substrate-binding protein
MSTMKRLGLIAVAVGLGTGLFAGAARVEASVAASSPLVVAYGLPVDTLDPQASSQQQTWVAWQLSYECLVQAQPNGKVVPWLASSYTVDPTATIYDFTLRKGVKFHNGETMTAADVVYTFTRLKATGIPYAQGRFPTLVSVAATSANTVRFTLSKPDAGFILNMGDTFAVGCAILSQKAGSSLATRMVGTGPWAMVSYTPTQELKLKRFDQYWGTKTGAAELRVVFIPDPSAQLVALQSAKVDLIFPDPSLVKPLKARKDVKLSSVISAGTLRVEFSAASPPLDNVDVRRAIEVVLNRPAVVRDAYLGYAKPAGYIPSAYTWAPNLDVYRYIGDANVAEARQLLAKGGVAGGFKTSYMYPGGLYPAWDRFAQVLKSQLSIIGIDVTLQPLDVATYLDKLGKSDYGMAHNSYPFFSDPLQYVRNRPNRNGPVPQEIADLVAAARASTSREQYLRIITQLAVVEDNLAYPNVVLLSPTLFAATRKNIGNVKLDFTGGWTFLANVTKT